MIFSSQNVHFPSLVGNIRHKIFFINILTSQKKEEEKKGSLPINAVDEREQVMMEISSFYITHNSYLSDSSGRKSSQCFHLIQNISYYVTHFFYSLFTAFPFNFLFFPQVPVGESFPFSLCWTQNKRVLYDFGLHEYLESPECTMSGASRRFFEVND